MHSCVTSKNVKWCHLIWPTLYAARVSGNVAAHEEDMDDYGDVGETATATGQPPASQSWAEQMDQADEARAAAAEAIVTVDSRAGAGPSGRSGAGDAGDDSDTG